MTGSGLVCYFRFAWSRCLFRVHTASERWAETPRHLHQKGSSYLPCRWRDGTHVTTTRIPKITPTLSKATFSFLLFQEVRRSAGKSRLWPKAESVVQSVKVWAGRRLKVWRSTWRTADRWAESSQTLASIRGWAANANISPHLFK